MKAAIGGDAEILHMVLKKLRETVAATSDDADTAMQVSDHRSLD